MLSPTRKACHPLLPSDGDRVPSEYVQSITDCDTTRRGHYMAPHSDTPSFAKCVVGLPEQHYHRIIRYPGTRNAMCVPLSSSVLHMQVPNPKMKFKK
ncbi:hypothetical protein M758_6G149300 [Ceratodon purpureus]|nr:hypothetical protein M758_6G149300 [Ceratodon purpureus]